MGYPNLKTEIDFHSYSSYTIALHAGVTERLLHAAAGGNETLTPIELHNIAGLLECKFKYLTAPALGTIKPGKKALRRLRILEDTLKEVADIKSDVDICEVFWRAHWVIAALKEHKTVEYAAYRVALGQLQWELKMAPVYKKPPRDCNTGIYRFIGLERKTA